MNVTPPVLPCTPRPKRWPWRGVASESMPSLQAITETVNRYLALVATGTADDIVTLYAADATIEDPIGADIRRGHDAIRAFYAGFQDAKKDTELAELRVSGSEAAFFWHLTLDAGDSRTRISPSRRCRSTRTPKSRRCGRSGHRLTSRCCSPVANPAGIWLNSDSHPRSQCFCRGPPPARRPINSRLSTCRTGVNRHGAR